MSIVKQLCNLKNLPGQEKLFRKSAMLKAVMSRLVNEARSYDQHYHLPLASTPQAKALFVEPFPSIPTSTVAVKTESEKADSTITVPVSTCTGSSTSTIKQPEPVKKVS